jgi:TPP-dependent trihydroxycyclohexane-1,2-dione (THcHDO) dehydratase
MVLPEAIIIAIIVALSGSPVILLIVQRLFAIKPKHDTLQLIADQLKMIEEIKKSFDGYKFEQAKQALTQKNWEVIEKKDASSFSYKEWLMLYNNLTSLAPEETWGEPLKTETIKARTILEGE